MNISYFINWQILKYIYSSHWNFLLLHRWVNIFQTTHRCKHLTKIQWLNDHTASVGSWGGLSSYCGGGVSGSMATIWLCPGFWIFKRISFTWSFSDLILRTRRGLRRRLALLLLRAGWELEVGAAGWGPGPGAGWGPLPSLGCCPSFSTASIRSSYEGSW